MWGPGPEATESAYQWGQCVKNPGHKAFIPMEKFNLHHLPEEWQRDDLMKLIKVRSVLTVRLRVNITSPSRPTDGSLFTVDNQGPRVGTGFVSWVVPTTGPCPCHDCQGQGQGEKQNQTSWTFHISTARHVVYDDYEAKYTFIDFFYDCVKSAKMKTMNAVKVWDTDDDIDWCEFTCVSHDEELAKLMLAQLDQCDTLWEGLADWMQQLKPYPMIIVSHPHGRPKHVTVGEYKDSEPDSYMFSYTTATCPGSSGAFVIGGWSLWSTSTGGNYYGLTHCLGGGPAEGNKGFYNWLGCEL